MTSLPSAAAQVIVTIIPIVGIVMGSAVLFFYLLWNYRAKRAIIEKGLYRKSEIDIDTLSLFLGLMLSGIGSALVLFFFLKKGISYSLLSGLIPFSLGVSMLLFFAVRMRVQKRNG